MEYPWYELIENSTEITQGDILKNCPVPKLQDVSKIEEKDKLKAEIEFVDGIILTQACDIANKKVDNIIMCSITSKTDFEELQTSMGKSKNNIKSSIASIIKGQQNAFIL